MSFEGIIRTNLALAGFTPEQIERLWKPLNDGALFLSRDGTTRLTDDYFDFARKIQNTANVLNVPASRVVRAALLEPTLLIRDADTLADNVQALQNYIPFDRDRYITRALKFAPRVVTSGAETIFNNITAGSAFLGVSKEEYFRIVSSTPSLLLAHPETLQANAQAHVDLLGISMEDFKKAARVEPTLMTKDANTTLRNAEGIAAVLGISLQRYLGILKSQGQEQLLVRSADTVRHHLEGDVQGGWYGMADLLGVPREDLVKNVLKRITLIVSTPRRINFNAKKAADLLGVDRQAYTAAALKRAPQLLTLRPTTINTNAERTAELLGIEKKAYVTAVAISAPQLLYQAPETISERVRQAAETLDLNKSEFVAMALKQPGLFYRDPSVIAHNARLMTLFQEKGILRDDPREFYKSKPDTLALAANNFHLRYIFARMSGMKDVGGFGVLRAPRGEIEQKLARLFGHDPETPVVTRPIVKGLDVPDDEKKHRAFVGLIRRGIVTKYRYEPEQP